jgi:hypothetical protein
MRALQSIVAAVAAMAAGARAALLPGPQEEMSEPRGAGRGFSRNRRPRGAIKRNQRQAVKARNVARNRRAQR